MADALAGSQPAIQGEAPLSQFNPEWSDDLAAVYASQCIGAVNSTGWGQDLTDINAMRRQHDCAEEMAASLLELITSYRDEYDAIGIARRIGKLNALLRVHFAIEDSTLYPAMVTGPDRHAAVLAVQFAEEMGALAESFEDFARRWSGPTAIATLFDEFRDEATALLAALGARIERENDLLYPLAERSLTARAA